jgi:hypothetical protein
MDYRNLIVKQKRDDAVFCGSQRRFRRRARGTQTLRHEPRVTRSLPFRVAYVGNKLVRECATGVHEYGSFDQTVSGQECFVAGKAL